MDEQEQYLKVSETMESMKEEIKKQIKIFEDRNEKYSEKLHNSRKPLNFVEKREIESSIKDYSDKLTEFRELEQSIIAFSSSVTSNGQRFSLPSSLQTKIQDVCTLLDEKEVKKVRELCNNNVHKANDVIKNDVQSKYEIVQKKLNKMGISKHSFLIYRYSGQKGYTGSTSTFEDAIKVKYEDLMKELIVPTNYFTAKDSDIEFLSFQDKQMLDSIENLVSSGKYEKNKDSKSIAHNLKDIKNMFCIKAKSEMINQKITLIIPELNAIDQVDMTNLVNYFQQITDHNKKVIAQANSYLQKFNFAEMQNQIKKQEQKEEKINHENNKISQYKFLIRSLLELEDKSPEKFDEIHEIKEQLNTYSYTSGLTIDELKTIREEAEKEYQQTKDTAQIKQGEIEEIQARENDAKRIIAENIRSQAIEELTREGAFNPKTIVKNGDVYDSYGDKEKMIDAKVAEIKSRPEEHKINIYREYIKYRAQLPNKNNFASFKQWSSYNYGMELEEPTMEDEGRGR